MSKIPWLNSNGELVDSLPFGSMGFVYQIDYQSGKKYIGKKKAVSVRKIKAKANGSKREGHIVFFNKIVKKRRTKYEKVITESKWREYEGSSESIDKDDKIIRKTILMILDNESAMTYYEAKLLFSSGAIESSRYYNESIFGRFFNKSTKGLIKF